MNIVLLILKTFKTIVVPVLWVYCSLCSLVFAQSIDAQLNLAKRSLATIETQLNGMKHGDVAQYNQVSAKLTKVADMLKKTESKAHPDFMPAIEKWSALQQSMVTIAQQWQQNTTPQQEKHLSSNQQQSVNPDTILAKYQKQNRPTLSDSPSPSEAKEWALRMRALQTTELKQDLMLLKQANIPAQDANRVSKWISGNFQQQIKADITTQFANTNAKIQTALQLAQRIEQIGNNETRAYNFAHGENGRNNANTLADGLRASAVGLELDQIFSQMADSQRQSKLAKIAVSQQLFSSLQQQSLNTAAKLAKQPKKKPARTSKFLANIAQDFWLNGSVFASIDKKGNVWIGSYDVGDIESNGKIWVRGNQLGSIETNGKVWFRGNHVGTLEENGKVWRSGSQVGLIEPNGKVWVNGNSNGEITPFKNEWKRAAILYYFRDFFAE